LKVENSKHEFLSWIFDLGNNGQFFMKVRIVLLNIFVDWEHEWISSNKILVYLLSKLQKFDNLKLYVPNQGKLLKMNRNLEI
jgi:hypothetical protein